MKVGYITFQLDKITSNSSIGFRKLYCEEITLSKQPQLVWIGVVSGKAIFGPPLDEYWKKKQQEEAAAKETDASSS
ncbi:hypothetical protein L3X38_034227 [Prunus dulcis]|uniref:Uncharacterized protein n=1 Tax=Prunus dulcis TaxID=3755 RepID=A0AAD4VIU7_PRUDU|nr:hypothetical protein L3X38_034227 [Prunus dulcis]